MELIERDTFFVCGYAVETNAASNAQDVARLYREFAERGREAALRGMSGSRAGQYGLLWYTQGHEKYCYLLGIEVDGGGEPPEGALLKCVPKAAYAMAKYPHDRDAIEAWAEFFFKDIPEAGYAPNERLNLYFEHYPEGEHGDYELWTPIVKAT